MPSTSISLTTATGQARTTFAIESGFLVAASLTPEAFGSGQYEAYAEIWLSETDNPTTVPGNILACGYIGASHGIGWTGKIHLEPNYSILANVYSTANRNYRLNFVISEVP